MRRSISAQPDSPVRAVSRRGLITAAAGAGVVTATGGFVGSMLVRAGDTAATNAAEAVHGEAESLLVRVRDLATGQLDLFVGTKHCQLRDPDLTARIALAARL